jgi:hypothetical protein
MGWGYDYKYDYKKNQYKKEDYEYKKEDYDKKDYDKDYGHGKDKKRRDCK